MIKVEQNDNLFDKVLDLAIAFLKKNNEVKKK